MTNPFNPYATTNAAGSFSVQSRGLIVGTAYNAPNARFNHAMGVLAQTETLPMWGGVPVVESIPSYGTHGSVLSRASSVSQITGFTVFDQAYSWLSSPQNPVPSAFAGMSVPFYRIGSGARIAVACDPSLADLAGSTVQQQLSWDFNNGVLSAPATDETVAIASATATYASGAWTIAITTSTASNVGAVGDVINISGLTGTGAYLVNGNQTVTAFTSNTSFSITVTAADNAISALGTASAVLNQDISTFAVTVLDIDVGNSKVPVFNPTTTAVTWNNSGSAAVILL